MATGMPAAQLAEGCRLHRLAAIALQRLLLVGGAGHVSREPRVVSGALFACASPASW